MKNPFLELGEIEFGGYKVQTVEWIDGEWTGTGLWLRAIVTNRRLLVFPEIGDQLQNPLTYAPSEIMKAWNVSLRGRDGIMVLLSDGRHLYMLVDWSQGSKLVKDINQMLLPPIKPRISPRPLPN
jgi:hypothetical protein